MTTARIFMRAALVAAVFLGACGKEQRKPLRLATTTSVTDSGLLAVLLPAFEKKSGMKVEVSSLGSGQALAKLASGEADVAITHAPGEEQAMLTEGRIATRTPFMRNDFVLVGPPAAVDTVAGSANAVDAMKRVADAKLRFVSRGDKSGTNQRELELWKQAGVPADAAFIRSVGAGMGATLGRASIEEAVTLSDRATFIAKRKELNLAILFQGDEHLANVYSVILPREGSAGRALAEYLKSVEGRAVIGGFGVAQHGEPLFTPLD